MIKKLRGMLFITIIIFSSISVLPVLAVDFPIADGVDINANKYTINKQNKISTAKGIFWDSYDYESSSFSLGVYIKNGEDFSISRKRNPYIKSAYHNRNTTSDPDIYRVTYQAIYSDSGEVRQGLPFYGPIDGIKVEFEINETDNFKFYIAGDGSNNYEAKGTLKY